jgi:hypothetical protein
MLPVVLYYWVGGLTDKDQPLTAPQVRRGAFVNSGTRDVGRDPDYDFATGTHPLQQHHGANELNKTAASLPGEFLALPARDLAKHEEKMQAFARGVGKNN